MSYPLPRVCDGAVWESVGGVSDIWVPESSREIRRSGLIWVLGSVRCGISCKTEGREQCLFMTLVCHKTSRRKTWTGAEFL